MPARGREQNVFLVGQIDGIQIVERPIGRHLKRCIPVVASLPGAAGTQAASAKIVLAKGAADDNTHGHVDYIAAHGKLLEFLDKTHCSNCFNEKIEMSALDVFFSRK